MKKILMISPFAKPNLGGVESHLEKLINHVISKDFYVVLLTYQPLTRPVKGPKFEKHRSFEIHRVNWFGNGLFNKLEGYFPLVFLYLYPGLFIKSLVYYLKHHKDVYAIHGHGLTACAIVRILVKVHPKNSIVSTHAIYNFKDRKVLKHIIRFLFNGLDTILAVSEVSRDEIVQMGVNPSNVKVIPNWIDTNKFILRNRNKIKAQLSLEQNSTNFLFIGRLIEKKGIKLFLNAALKLPEYNFHVVGGGDEERYVQKLASKHKNIFYHGILMQENKSQFNKIINLYNVCIALISPYLYDEGFSTTLIECVSCGTPVIITDRGSPPTFLDKSVYFELPSDLTTEDIINQIQKSLNKLNNINRTEIRDFALKNFSSANANIAIDAYKKE